jgi:uncharacterized membrane protein
MDKKISFKTILLISYLITLLVIGVFFVPNFEVWGPAKEIKGYSYKFIFNIVNNQELVNGYKVLYQIDYIRQLYTIAIITLLFAVIWKVITLWEKEDKVAEKVDSKKA